jgi:hypothetical protein
VARRLFGVLGGAIPIADLYQGTAQ